MAAGIFGDEIGHDQRFRAWLKTQKPDDECLVIQERKLRLGSEELRNQGRNIMKIGLVLFAICAGILNTVQSGSNATLGKVLNQPVWSAVTVYLVGLIAIALAAPFLGVRLPNPQVLRTVPWWAWLGGMFGAVYVIAMLTIAGKLGAALFQSMTVTAAIVTSLALDHFGWMGFPIHKLTAGRFAGGLLMVMGVFLVSKF
jgi:transporter family-2 protein